MIFNVFNIKPNQLECKLRQQNTLPKIGLTILQITDESNFLVCYDEGKPPDEHLLTEEQIALINQVIADHVPREDVE